LDSFALLVRPIWALAVITLVLLATWWLVRVLGRGRLVASSNKRLVSVIESTFLMQNTTLHVVKVGESYYLVGGGAGHVSLVCEVPSENVEPWLDAQRKALDDQRQTLASFFDRLRGLRR
jgi:flagellar biogenesis protein FliO